MAHTKVEEGHIGSKTGRMCRLKGVRPTLSYNKLNMKTESGGFSALVPGVFDPGNGIIGQALLKLRFNFLRDLSNNVCRLCRTGVRKFFDT